jgi:hypothetical protein
LIWIHFHNPRIRINTPKKNFHILYNWQEMDINKTKNYRNTNR